MLKSKLWLWKYCRRRFLTWPHFGISSTDPNGRPTLYSIISSTIGKLAFEWSNLRILSTDSKIVPQESTAQLLSFEWSRHRLFLVEETLWCDFRPWASKPVHRWVCLFVFSFRFFRKTPSPVLAPKEPEKSPERLAKGSKSSKDLKKLVTMVLLFFYFIANNNEGRYFCEEQSFIISVGKPGFC